MTADTPDDDRPELLEVPVTNDVPTVEHLQAVNAELVARLDRRDAVMDHLLALEQAIGARVPVREVLDAVLATAATLLPGRHVELRFDEQPPETPETDRSRSEPGADAVPVRRNGVVVGALLVSSAPTSAPTSGNAAPLTGDEQRLVRALAEHASLALSDASAIDVLHRSILRADFDAQHDQLTGLANRVRAISRLGEWAEQGLSVTVIFVDLDRFKSVNDAYGAATGDEILRQVADRLADATRVDDLVARLSGDEFLVIAASPDDQTAVDLAERIAERLVFMASVGVREIPVTASVGCARMLPGESAEEAIANADLATFRAKELGGGRLVRFDGAMREERTAELSLEREIRFAVEHDELEVYFQPIVDLATERLIGAEALIRWHHPERGLVSPDEFLPAAEAAGVIAAVDAVALHQALGHLADWETAGRVPEGFRISVNIAAGQFEGRSIVDTVRAELADSGRADRLWLEITETAMMRDVEVSLATMHELRGLGVHLAVDDFGTGWSSLAYLKQLPVDALKIDQSFVAGLCVDADDHAIVEATIRLAGSLGLGVIAEGVEERGQAEELLRLGCGSSQGFLYSPARPAADFAADWLS